ncbi:MAG: 5-dehydro-2-deoxygluconokinase [Brevinema sp.]
MKFDSSKKNDVIAIGRAGVDFYATESEKDFNDVLTFERYVGGSPANIAVALAKRGAKVGFIGKVSDDMLGKYVLHYFRQQQIDTSHILLDCSNHTRVTLAVTETKATNCGVVIYRNNASDTYIDIADIKEEYIKQTKILLVSGATLAMLPSRDASLYAIELAHKHNVKVVLDLDYRAYSWRCPEEVSIYYELAAKKSHIIIGNREEFDALEYIWLKDNKDDNVSAQRFLNYDTEIVIIKHGEKGSTTFLKDGSVVQGHLFTMPSILKPHGAGDAFAGNFLYELLQENTIQKALESGAAAAAMVVSQHICCSEANPTTEELEEFITKYKQGEYNA